MFDNKIPRVSTDDWLSAINSMNDLVMILDLDHRILAVNEATLQAIGSPESEVVGRNCYEVFHGRKNPPPECPHEYLKKSSSSHTCAMQMEMLDRVYMLTAAPIRDANGRLIRVAYTGKDITGQDSSKRELQKINRALETLIECNKVLAQPSEELQLLHHICEVIVTVGGYHLAWIGFALDDEEKTVKPVVNCGYNDSYLDTVQIVWADTERGRGPSGTAIRTGQPVVCQNIQKDPQFTPWREQALKRGYASSVSLPLIVNGKAVGALNIYAVEKDAFNEQEVGILFGLASDVAYGITARRVNVERRQRESELARKESEWANAMDFIEDAVYLVDLDDRVQHANKKFYAMIGLPPEHVIGRDICTIMHPEGELLPCPVCLARRERKDTFIVMDADHPDNPVGKPIQVMVKIIRDAKQAPVSILMGVRDLSPVEELRKQGQIIDQINEAVIATDLQGNITTWNNGAGRLIGYSAHEVIGRNISHLLNDEMNYADLARLSRLEALIRKKSGDTFYGFISSSEFKNQMGEKTGTIFIINNVSQRKEAEKQQENQARIWALGSDVGQAVTTGHDLREMLQDCCEAIVRRLEVPFARVWVYDSAENMLILQGSAGMYTHINGEHGRIPINKHSKIGQIAVEKKAMLTNAVIGDPQIRNQEWARKKGMVAFAGHPLLVGNLLVGVMALFSREPLSNFISRSLESIAERIGVGIERNLAEAETEKLQNQIRQMQKMEAIGTLAGGIAHDFNNILTPIIGFGDLLKFEIDANNPARESVEEILQAAKRAKELVRQILAFSRQTQQERRPLQPHLIIKEALKLLKASIPSIVTIHAQIDSQCEAVMADPTEVHQIMMNLCTNAYHVMMEEGGFLEVSLENVSVNAELARSNPQLAEGHYVRLTVKDSGPGMEPALLDRIFEPYFTTKKIGEGTGMGLALVHGIVQSLEGGIVVESAVGKGSRFQVYLPSLKKAQVEPSPIRQDMPRGKERILLVDDEGAVAQFGKRALQMLGYEVTIRTGSLEALELFQAEPEKFDLLITDQMMPNMAGTQLSQRIKAIRADIPIILLTGFSHNLTPEQLDKAGIGKCAMKPLLVDELAQIIRNILDGE
ncbi:MAG: GAF domain-containing protein [Desulfobulbaceae bacterium]|nr:GAF domain-containing protein [Desulfobulbaceae bacterium]